MKKVIVTKKVLCKPRGREKDESVEWRHVKLMKKTVRNNHINKLVNQIGVPSTS